jgi:2OG-Fe(II) oxygenase superfamily
MTALGRKFVRYVAESLFLPASTFEPFLGEMSRLKFIKYPPALPGSQGVGPHKDSISLFTFLAQDSVGGLQVLNKSGEWINATPIEGSLVVNVAQGFEAITGGVCSGTTHRVIVCLTPFSVFLLVSNILGRHRPQPPVTAFHSFKPSDWISNWRSSSDQRRRSLQRSQYQTTRRRERSMFKAS